MRNSLYHYILVESFGKDVQLFRIEETGQYIILSHGCEYNFALEEDARRFAHPLADFREKHKQGSFDRSKPETALPPTTTREEPSQGPFSSLKKRIFP